MRGRRISTERGKVVKPPPTILPQGLYSWGFDYEGALGGGYEHYGQGFSFPQGVITVDKVVDIACGERHTIVAKENGAIYMWGTKRIGVQGDGAGTDLAGEESQPTPLQVMGGIPLWKDEFFEDKSKPPKTFELKESEAPVAPLMATSPTNILIPCTQVAAANITAFARTADGRVLAWGSGADVGLLANGWHPEHSEFPQRKYEAGKLRPQRAPWWVQTGPPIQAVAPGETNILKGVKEVAATFFCAYFLKENGEVWYCGSPTQVEDVIYAEPEPLWAAEGDLRAVEIDCGHDQYTLRLNNGEVRVVGYCKEGMWGTGVEEEKELKKNVTREVKTPEISPGVPLTGVIQISQGQYNVKALKSDGTLWTWGSNGTYPGNNPTVFNDEPSQGLGAPIERPPTKRPVQITSLGNQVKEIRCGGMIRGTGTFGGDVCIALMKDETIRTWGKNNDTDTGPSNFHGQGTGTLGDTTYENKGAPTPVALSNITKVETGQAHMVVVQQPGAPATPTIKATIAGKVVTVEWEPVAGAAGEMPTWRLPESWDVLIQRQGENPATKKSEAVQRKNKLSYATRSQAFTVTTEPWPGAPKTFEISVIENAKGESPAITTPGAIPYSGDPGIGINAVLLSSSGGKLKVEWANPVKEELGWYVEWQRNEEYLDKNGKLTKDNFVREPEIQNPAARSYEWTPTPSPHGLTTTQFVVEVYGTFGGRTKAGGSNEDAGSYRKRVAFIEVPTS
jgi:alpha-tubulin suppressor-like RCC1 family protein